MEGIEVRALKEGDLDTIMDIERASFPLPWTRGEFRQEFHANPGGLKVAELEGVVAGYSVSRVELAFEVRKFRIYRRCHLLKIAVAPGLRKRGVGERLLQEVVSRAERKGLREILLEVRLNNFSARRFYSRRGFREVRYKKGFYGRESAVVMVRDLKPTPQ